MIEAVCSVATFMLIFCLLARLHLVCTDVKRCPFNCYLLSLNPRIRLSVVHCEYRGSFVRIHGVYATHISIDTHAVWFWWKLVYWFEIQLTPGDYIKLYSTAFKRTIHRIERSRAAHEHPVYKGFENPTYYSLELLYVLYLFDKDSTIRAQYPL